MRDHLITPPPRVLRPHWQAGQDKPPGPGPQSGRRQPGRRQRVWDWLCAAAVIALLLATVGMVCAYAAREIGLYQGGGVAALNAPSAPALAPSSQAAGQSSAQGSAQAPDSKSAGPIDRGRLIAFSMGINLLIFVGLGLYLRWDMEREQEKRR